jgi:hypothetical protein
VVLSVLRAPCTQIEREEEPDKITLVANQIKKKFDNITNFVGTEANKKSKVASNNSTMI